MRVVGVTRGPEDLIANGEATIATSPAMFDALSGADVFASYLGVRLKPGVTVAEFEDSLGSDFSGGARGDPVSFTARTKAVRDAISTLADGLVVFAIAAGAASVVVVALAVGRHLGGRTREQDVLVALGMSPAARFAGLVLVAAPIAVGGAVLAVAGALLASPMMPIGLARRAEPDPGFAVDWSVVVAGLLGVVALVCAAAALGSVANHPQRAWRGRTRSTVAPSGRGESVGCRSERSPPAWSSPSTAARRRSRADRRSSVSPSP